MALEAKNLYFKYRSSGPWIIEDCNLAVERGEIVSLIAPSGYGKSTLAMLLAGYLAPQSGTILADGAPLPKKGIRPVQLVYQHPEKAINPRWKLKKVLEESGKIDGKILSDFGIERAWLNRYPRELSGGELQRFSLARAVSSGAPYLICDEISTMLDVITQAQIWNIVLKKAKEENMGLIAITHNRHLAERISTRIIDGNFLK